jgi:hypothetical protein
MPTLRAPVKHYLALKKIIYDRDLSATPKPSAEAGIRMNTLVPRVRNAKQSLCGNPLLDGVLLSYGLFYAVRLLGPWGPGYLLRGGCSRGWPYSGENGHFGKTTKKAAVSWDHP